MKQYFSRADTPLKFHYFLWYVSLPLGIICTLVAMGSGFSDIVLFNWIYTATYTVAYILLFLFLGLTLAAFIGFFRWKSYAWYCIMSILVFDVAVEAFTVLLDIVIAPDEIAYAIGQLIGSLIYSTLVGIYYYKRKPLFFPRLVPSAPGAPLSYSGAPCAPGTPYASGVSCTSGSPCVPISAGTPLAPCSSASADSSCAPGAIREGQQPQSVYCRKCGAKLSGDSTFCSYCGAPVFPVPSETGSICISRDSAK